VGGGESWGTFVDIAPQVGFVYFDFLVWMGYGEIKGRALGKTARWTIRAFGFGVGGRNGI
jgi:hypothetical protein